jgi:hypothetical protein
MGFIDTFSKEFEMRKVGGFSWHPATLSNKLMILNYLSKVVQDSENSAKIHGIYKKYNNGGIPDNFLGL